MSKVKEPAKPYDGQLFSVNDPVIIRSGLWTNCTGEIVKVDEKTGEHLVKILAKGSVAYPSHFHASVSGKNLDIWI